MITRRSFLGSALVYGAYQTFGSARADVPNNLALWPDAPPGGGGPVGAIVTEKNGAIHNISSPSVQIFMPDRPTGAAMLVAGGGGYKRISMKREAYIAADWLNSLNIIACVLSYRLPQEGWLNGPMAPLQDAQRAIKLLRNGSFTKSVDPQRIGVMGFSAGGHLMGMAAARSDFAAYEAIDANDEISARPNVSILAYPVITLEPPYDKTSTRKVLIGEKPTPASSAEWSVQTHVRGNCPPTFLVQAANDPISKPQNTLIMEEACEKAHVPVERHLLPSGGHGFAMGKDGSPTKQWPDFLEHWLGDFV